MMPKRALDIMIERHDVDVASNEQVSPAVSDRGRAESAWVAAETASDWARSEVRRAKSASLEDNGISIDHAKWGVEEARHL